MQKSCMSSASKDGKERRCQLHAFFMTVLCKDEGRIKNGVQGENVAVFAGMKRASIRIFLNESAFSTTCPLVHVVEKAIGVTHIEIKHPACCTAAQKSFLNRQDFLYLIMVYRNDAQRSTSLGRVVVVIGRTITVVDHCSDQEFIENVRKSTRIHRIN